MGSQSVKVDGIILNESRKLLHFLAAFIANSGGILFKLGWLWTVNCKPINFCKMHKLIQSTEMGQLIFF